MRKAAVRPILSLPPRRRALLPPEREFRVLTLLHLMTATAGGVYFSSSVLFFVKVVGLTPSEIALGLTLSGAVGLAVSVPFGVLADRLGARDVAAWLILGVGISFGLFLLAGTFWGFIVAACSFAACLRGAMAARMAMVAGLADAAQRTRLSAYLRAFGNAGLSIGALVGSLALFLDTPGAFRSTFSLSAALYVAAAAGYRLLPRVPPADRSDQRPSLAVFVDRPFVALTFLNTVVLLYIPLLNMVMPLWIISHTQAPIWIASLLYGVNTLSVVLLQVRLARRVVSPQAARRSILLASWLLCAACLLFAAMAWPAIAWQAAAVGVAATILHALAEMMHMAGAWELSFRLAPAAAHGQYQGFFAMSSAAAETLGPMLLTALLVDWGIPGWFVLAVIFLAAGLAINRLGGQAN